MKTCESEAYEARPCRHPWTDRSKVEDLGVGRRSLFSEYANASVTSQAQSVGVKSAEKAFQFHL